MQRHDPDGFYFLPSFFSIFISPQILKNIIGDTAVKIVSFKIYFENIFPFPFQEMSSPKCNFIYSKRKKIRSPVHRIEKKNHIPKHVYVL